LAAIAWAIAPASLECKLLVCGTVRCDDQSIDSRDKLTGFGYNILSKQILALSKRIAVQADSHITASNLSRPQISEFHDDYSLLSKQAYDNHERNNRGTQIAIERAAPGRIEDLKTVEPAGKKKSPEDDCLL
jgi:hypothetical protein